MTLQFDSNVDHIPRNIEFKPFSRIDQAHKQDTIRRITSADFCFAFPALLPQCGWKSMDAWEGGVACVCSIVKYRPLARALSLPTFLSLSLSLSLYLRARFVMQTTQVFPPPTSCKLPVKHMVGNTENAQRKCVDGSGF